MHGQQNIKMYLIHFLFGFPVSLKQMLGWFPCLQVVTTCFSCSPPEVHSSIRTTTRLLYTCYKPLPPGSNPIAVE